MPKSKWTEWFQTLWKTDTGSQRVTELRNLLQVRQKMSYSIAYLTRKQRDVTRSLESAPQTVRKKLVARHRSLSTLISAQRDKVLLIENACDTLTTMQTLDSSVLAAIKQVTSQINTDVVAELQDNLSILTDELEACTDILTEPIGGPAFDDDELEKELNELVADPEPYLGLPTAPTNTPQLHDNGERNASTGRGSVDSFVRGEPLLETCTKFEPA